MTDWKRLIEPFPEADVEWRIGRAQKNNERITATVLAYITARAIQERLDEVFTPGGWKNEYRTGPAGGVICRIWFKADDGEWVWREDGAENTDIEGVKGGISGATKRAGAALGIGRYLYDLEEGWAHISDKGKHYARLPKDKGGDAFKWDPPQLPKWALPDGAPQGQQERRQPPKQEAPELPPYWQSFREACEAQSITPQEIESVIGAKVSPPAVDAWLTANGKTSEDLLSEVLLGRATN